MDDRKSACVAMLEAKEAELIAGLKNREGLTAELEADFLDQIQSATERAFVVQTLDWNSLQLHEVRAALARIAEGTYGQCVRCDESIGPKRLAAVPWATLCLHCQEDLDRERGSDFEDREGAFKSGVASYTRNSGPNGVRKNTILPPDEPAETTPAGDSPRPSVPESRRMVGKTRGGCIVSP